MKIFNLKILLISLCLLSSVAFSYAYFKYPFLFYPNYNCKILKNKEPEIWLHRAYSEGEKAFDLKFLKERDIESVEIDVWYFEGGEISEIYVSHDEPSVKNIQSGNLITLQQYVEKYGSGLKGIWLDFKNFHHLSSSYSEIKSILKKVEQQSQGRNVFFIESTHHKLLKSLEEDFENIKPLARIGKFAKLSATQKIEIVSQIYSEGFCDIAISGKDLNSKSSLDHRIFRNINLFSWLANSEEDLKKLKKVNSKIILVD